MPETTKRLIAKLKRELGKDIIEMLENDEVIEIMLNPDGSLWIEELGKDMRYISTPNINAKSIIGTIASILDTTITIENPIISCELPIDGSRFEGLIPPIVENTSFTIRKKALKIFTLEDYLNVE